LDGLVGPIGVSILVALGTLAGVVLVTGASVGVLMRTSGTHMARAAGAGVRLSEEVGRRYRQRPAGRPILRAGPSPEPSTPPVDGSHAFADLFGEVPELDEAPEPPVAAEPEPELEPEDVTDDDPFDEPTPVLAPAMPAPNRTPYRLPK